MKWILMIFLIPILAEAQLKLQPDLAVNFLKVTQAEDKSGLSAVVFPSAGVGVALRDTSATLGYALDIFMGGEIGGKFILTPILRVEFLNGWLSLGVGYDIGYVGSRSRVTGALSTKVSL